MKKLPLINFLSICLFLNIFFINSVQSQSINDFKVSPASYIVYEDQIGNTYQVTLKNRSSSLISLTPSEVYFTNNNGQMVQAKTKEKLDYLDFITDTFTLEPNQSIKFDVRVRLLNQDVKYYPAIVFAQNTSKADVAQATIFTIQNINGELSFKTDISIKNYKFVATNPKIFLNANLINDGSKFFDPQGVIRITKGQTVLSEQALSSEQTDLLFAGDQKSYSFEWQNEQNIINSIGVYQIQSEIKPLPYNENHKSVIQFIYIPLDVILLGVIGSITIIAIIIIFKKMGRKHAIEN